MHPTFDFTTSTSPFLSPVFSYNYLCSPNPSSFTPALNYKTRVCRHFQIGRCQLGDLCNFAHGEEEARLYRERSLSDRLDQKTPKSNNENGKNLLNPNLLKIEKAENQLDVFYLQQKSILERLKISNSAMSFNNQDHRELVN